MLIRVFGECETCVSRVLLRYAECYERGSRTKKAAECIQAAAKSKLPVTSVVGRDGRPIQMVMKRMFVPRMILANYPDQNFRLHVCKL